MTHDDDASRRPRSRRRDVHRRRRRRVGNGWHRPALEREFAHVVAPGQGFHRHARVEDGTGARRHSSSSLSRAIARGEGERRRRGARGRARHLRRHARGDAVDARRRRRRARSRRDREVEIASRRRARGRRARIDDARARARVVLAHQTLFALGAQDAVAVAATPAAYAPSPYAAEDGLAQLFVCVFVLVVGGVGMKVSLEGETEARGAAPPIKCARETKAMSEATSTTMEAVGGEEEKVRGVVEARGVVRVNDVLSEEASAEMSRYVDETLRANDAGTTRDLSMETFGNVYCKKNRWDLKLAYDAPVRRALGECVRSMREVLTTTCGEDAELVELAALVSDPGSTRQPVHPDTAYRRDPSVFTCFVALQDVERDMGPTLFIPDRTTRRRRRVQRGSRARGPVLQRPYELGVISRGDATLFDSRTLHCGTENESARRRVLFYFSFQRLRAKIQTRRLARLEPNFEASIRSRICSRD